MLNQIPANISLILILITRCLRIVSKSIRTSALIHQRTNPVIKFRLQHELRRRRTRYITSPIRNVLKTHTCCACIFTTFPSLLPAIINQCHAKLDNACLISRHIAKPKHATIYHQQIYMNMKIRKYYCYVGCIHCSIVPIYFLVREIFYQFFKIS